MPTRLMIWNIQFFTIKRIQYSKGIDLMEQLLNTGQSAANRGHILNNIVNAHIFVMIETLSSRGVLGTLIGGKGAQGVLYLLKCLREQNASWCLVPPLKLVGLNEAGEASQYTEGIAVFYRSDQLDFLGPYVWPTDGPVAVPPGPGVTPGPYPDPWAEALPAGNTFAGQAQFFSDIARTHELLFVSGNNRRPFLTAFRERDAPKRLIKLVSSHPSPGANAKTAVARLLDIREIANTGVPQVVVLAGDFNVNVFATDTVSKQAYSLLEMYTFKQHFTRTTSGNGRTRIQYVPDATPTSYLLPEGLDNIFTRYDGLQPPAHNPQIIDRVAGVPNYPSDMLRSLAQLAQDFPDQNEQTNRFRSLLNYGHIAARRGTSDHIALVLDL